MHEKSNKWLTQEIDFRGDQSTLAKKGPRYKRLAYLVCCNGGRWDSRTYGIVGYAGGPFKEGLDYDEHVELNAYGHFMSGLIYAGIPIFDDFKPLYNNFIKETEKAFKKETGVSV